MILNIEAINTLNVYKNIYRFKSSKSKTTENLL